MVRGIMFRKILALFVLVCVAACDDRAEAETIAGPFGTQTVVENAEHYHHKLVRVRGYLSGDSMGMYINATNIDDAIYDDPYFGRYSIKIIDNSPDSRLFFDYQLKDPNCVGHYAEVIGRYAYTDAARPSVMIETHEIRIWKTKSAFDGPGEVCFAKEDNHYPDSDYADAPLGTKPGVYDKYKYPGHYLELEPSSSEFHSQSPAP